MNRRTFALRQPTLASAAVLLGWWGAVAPAAAQLAFKVQTPTALPPTPQTWSFLALANGDLAAVQRQGAKGMTEVHILSAADNYQRFSLQSETALPAVDEHWDFVALPNRDIAGVQRAGASGKTDIHVLDAGKGYKRLKLHAPTALPASDRRWSFGANGEGDLVGINRLGVGGKTEIHIADSAKKYGRFQLQTETALPATDTTWDFGVLSNGDLLAIKRRGDSGRTEWYALDAARSYKAFKRQAVSPLQQADEAWKFAVRGNGEVMAVLTEGGASGKSELRIFDRV